MAGKLRKIAAERFIAEFFSAHLVTHFFYVPVCLYQVIKEMTSLGIQPIAAHSEKAAAYMADGYARASGRPGLCGAQSIGGTNLASGLRDALQGHIPVIAISGGKDLANTYRGSYQEIDDMPIYDALTKFNASIQSASRWSDLLPAAFRAATTGIPAPVHIECAGITGEQSLGEILAPSEIDSQYACFPALRFPASQSAIEGAVALIEAAERPIVVAGGGVWSSGGQTQLIALAQHLSLPVATSLNGKGLIPDSHPLSVGVVGDYSRDCANKAVCAADLVIFIGSHTGGLTTVRWNVPPPGTQVIHIDIDPEVIGRNYSHTLGLCGDARTVMSQVVAASASSAMRGSWMERIRELKTDWRKTRAAYEESSAMPIRPERLCHDISAFLPEDAVVVGDTGHAGMWIAQHFYTQHVGQRFMRAAGSLGWGLPAAIGAKCALPQRPVICFTGDGGFMIHMAELETAVRYSINIVVVVNNNQGLSQEEILWRENPAWDKNWRLAPVDVSRLAESMGCQGIRVTQPDQIGPALRQAFNADRPVVIDVLTDVKCTAALSWTPSKVV
jgi:acetolactate synthase-1/2/3 large subunit